MGRAKRNETHQYSLTGEFRFAIPILRAAVNRNP
jgi:hypothetical protein